MLFSGQSLIIGYLTPQAFTLYGPKGGLGRFDMPAGSIQNLELADGKSLLDLTAELAKTLLLSKRRVLLVLDDALVFRRAISRTTPAQDQALLEDIKNKVPFAPENKGFVVASDANFITLYATNKLIYETVCAGLEQAGVELAGVVPFAGQSEEAAPVELTPSLISALARNRKLQSAVNFLGSH